MEKKDHYRNVFKSDHLSSADLEDLTENNVPLIFKIKQVIQQKGAKVAGKKIDANIAYFHENIKPLVLNATNSKTIKSFAPKTTEYPNGSPFVNDWKDLVIELYVDDNVQMKGEKTQGIRVRPIQPKIAKEKPIFTESLFSKAKEANANIESIKNRYVVSQEIETKYLDYVGAKE